jgi:hypothetical protein
VDYLFGLARNRRLSRIIGAQMQQARALHQTTRKAARVFTGFAYITRKSWSRVRTKVKWPFRILKRVFGYTKVRHRGIVKNHHWHLAALALVNLYQHRKRLVPQRA